jgi:ABC-type nitrate/sulfonate/bicarbonate transport system ATPase subunit
MSIQMPNNLPIDIQVSGLCKEYWHGTERRQIIDDLSFSVPRGALVAIVGPSGCGKSTLLRILSGSETQTSGSFQVVNPERAKAQATIEQMPALLPWRTAFQNAYVGTEIYLSRLHAAQPEVQADIKALKTKLLDYFRTFELSPQLDQYPDRLSGGEKQRVAIIRALQSNPRILFCDEPFSAIDFVTRLHLNTEFKKISRLLQCTTIFVTHNIEEAIFLGDRIIILSKSPCRKIEEIEPRLGHYAEDAIKCRQSPEFLKLFDRILNILGL